MSQSQTITRRGNELQTCKLDDYLVPQLQLSRQLLRMMKMRYNSTKH